MDSKTNLRKVEARLGFNFDSGLSKDGRAKQTPETHQLLKRIESINKQFYHLDWREIRDSEGVRSATEEVFNELGPVLWPDFDKISGPFPTWLLRPDRPKVIDSDLNDFYRRDLFFSSPTHHQILSRHFYALISLKLLRYHQNHFHKKTSKKAPRKALVPVEDTLDSDLDIESDSDDDEYVDSTSHEDYSPSSSPPRRRSGRARPRAITHSPASSANPEAEINPEQQQEHSMGNTQTKLTTLDTHTQQKSNTSGSRPTLITILKVGSKGLELSGGSQATSPTTTPGARNMSAAMNSQNDPLSNAAQPEPTPKSGGKRKSASSRSTVAPKKISHTGNQFGRKRTVSQATISDYDDSDQPETVHTSGNRPGGKSIGGSINALEDAPIISSRASKQIRAENHVAGRASESALVDHDVSTQAASNPPQVMQQIGADSLINSTTGEFANVAQMNQLKEFALPEPKTAPRDPMSDVFLNLYLDEAATTEEPLGCITLAGLSTKEELFDEVEAILEGEYGAGETISMIRVRRADGGVFPGPNVLSLPIPRGGRQDGWSTLVQMVRNHGTGNGCLRGYVKVRKGAENK